MKNKKLVIAADHAGFEYKAKLISYLTEKGYEMIDAGTYSAESCDYPIPVHALCKVIQSGECDEGILICGTGIGVSMAANKHRGIRAAVCSDKYSTEMTRLHNDANVLCMGARVIDTAKAIKLTDIFLDTEFMGDKHLTRINMIADIENK